MKIPKKVFSVKKRTEFGKCFDYLRKGDTLIVWKLNRIGSTTKKLIELNDDLKESNINLQVITLGVDTSTASRRLFFSMIAGLAEIEHEVIRERKNADLKAARARRRLGGRKKINQDILQMAYGIYDVQSKNDH